MNILSKAPSLLSAAPTPHNTPSGHRRKSKATRECISLLSSHCQTLGLDKVQPGTLGEDGVGPRSAKLSEGRGARYIEEDIAAEIEALQVCTKSRKGVW